MSILQTCQLGCAACRILCFRFCCGCMRKKRIIKEEYPVLLLGLKDAGKSTLLALLCNEATEDVTPTKGFSIKDVALSTSLLHVKEVGGSEKIRQYWQNYFDGVEGLIYLLDGCGLGDEFVESRDELQKATFHPALAKVPVLVLINKANVYPEMFCSKINMLLASREPSNSSSFIVEYYNLDTIDRARSALDKFADLLYQQRTLATLSASSNCEQVGENARI